MSRDVVIVEGLRTPYARAGTLAPSRETPLPLVSDGGVDTPPPEADTAPEPIRKA